MQSREVPLSRSAFLILIALADQPRHGLGIIDEVEARTEGQVKLGPGTLYGALHKLSADGLIREVSDAPDPLDDDPRRRYYRLTSSGERALREEAGRLQTLVNVALSKKVLST